MHIFETLYDDLKVCSSSCLRLEQYGLLPFQHLLFPVEDLLVVAIAGMQMVSLAYPSDGQNFPSFFVCHKATWMKFLLPSISCLLTKSRVRYRKVSSTSHFLDRKSTRLNSSHH